MAKKMSAFEYGGGGDNVSRPGIHAKSKTSNHKQSKNYKKSYRGQGR